MTQPLNYTPKAIEALFALKPDAPQADPAVGAGIHYLISKLREAQTFILTDGGQLLDRQKPRPVMPEIVLHPPFPVVALEYSVAPKDWADGIYSQERCSRRIALAWDWQDDLPAGLRQYAPTLSPGVVIASLAFYDALGEWLPISATAHIPYEGAYGDGIELPHYGAMVACGRARARTAGEAGLRMSILPLLPKAVFGIAARFGSAALVDVLLADLMDEVNAYTDLAMALACKNVGTREHPAPAALNRQRIKRGKLPLKGFHVLELNGGAAMPGAGGSGGSGSPRSHLRRGHIRRLPGERVTWVNATIARGSGFVEKVYAV